MTDEDIQKAHYQALMGIIDRHLETKRGEGFIEYRFGSILSGVLVIRIEGKDLRERVWTEDGRETE